MHEDAEAELRKRWTITRRSEPAWAGEFRQEFEVRLRRVQENPQAYAAEDDAKVRYCPLRRFLYTLVYVELDERIWVAAVANQRRRPRYLVRRQPD